MDKDQFDKIPDGQQYSVVKTYLDLVYDAVSKRMEMLPAISALAATLLVVATFNQNLIVLDNFVRFLISVLLLIIPISLFAYNWDLKKAQIKNQKLLEEMLRADLTSKNLTKLDKITSWLPDILIWIIIGVILCVIFTIWKKAFYYEKIYSASIPITKKSKMGAIGNDSRRFRVRHSSRALNQR